MRPRFLPLEIDPSLLPLCLTILDRKKADEWMDGWTDRQIPLCSTVHSPLRAAALLSLNLNLKLL